MNKKILHISNTDIDYDNRIRKELISLGEIEGVEIMVVGLSTLSNKSTLEIDGAQYFKVKLGFNSLRFLPRAVRYFFELIEFTLKVLILGFRINPSVVHCHDTFALPAGWFIKLFKKSRLVYDAHELESNKNGQNAALSYATLLIEKICWPKVDLLISVSDSILNWYNDNLGSKNNILILNSPVFNDSQCWLDASAEKERYFNVRFNIPKDHTIFVYLGILGPGRGIEMCLDAFSTGSERAHIVFIGFGQFKANIIEFSRKYPNIHFHEAIQHDKVVELVRNADYGICLIQNISLSDYYCLPNKLFEYCFAGIPVLASNFPDISDCVDRYSLGICCEPKSDAIKHSLNFLTNQVPMRINSDLYEISWDAQSKRLRNAYKNLL